jgi:hypothetical protein
MKPIVEHGQLISFYIHSVDDDDGDDDTDDDNPKELCCMYIYFYYYNLLRVLEHAHSSAKSAVFACTPRILLCRVSSVFDDYTSLFTQVSARTAKNASG